MISYLSMSVPNSNEPANHPILRTRSDKQEIASSTHDNYEQLPKNFVRQSSLVRSILLINSLNLD
jgi:hypothetical protein